MLLLLKNWNQAKLVTLQANKEALTSMGCTVEQSED